MKPAIIGAVFNRAYLGTGYAQTNYVKESFTVTFHQLTQSEHDALKKLLSQPSPLDKFIFIYGVDSRVSIWDGATDPSGETNADVSGKRNKVRVTSIDLHHHDNIPTMFLGTVEFEEC
jgi:hypothetical protein